MERDLPPPSEHGESTEWVELSSVLLLLLAPVADECPACCAAGGPLCAGSISIPLAPASQQQLAAVLRGTARSAQLLRANTSGEASAALYPLVWLLRGDACVGSPLQLRDVLPAVPGTQAWSGLWAACNASLLPLPSSAEQAAPGLESGGSAGDSLTQLRRLAGVAGSGGEVAKAASTARWWQLACRAVNSTGEAVELQAEEPGMADCGADYAGPR